MLSLSAVADHGLQATDTGAMTHRRREMGGVGATHSREDVLEDSEDEEEEEEEGEQQKEEEEFHSPSSLSKSGASTSSKDASEASDSKLGSLSLRSKTGAQGPQKAKLYRHLGGNSTKSQWIVADKTVSWEFVREGDDASDGKESDSEDDDKSWKAWYLLVGTKIRAPVGEKLQMKLFQEQLRVDFVHLGVWALKFPSISCYIDFNTEFRNCLFENTYMLEATEENKIKVFGKDFMGWANPEAADESIWEDAEDTFEPLLAPKHSLKEDYVEPIPGGIQSLTMGALDRSFLVSAEGIEAVRNMPSGIHGKGVSVAFGKEFRVVQDDPSSFSTPKKAMLIKGESSLMVMSPSSYNKGTPHATGVHQLDVSTGKVVAQWKFEKDGTPITMRDVTNESKGAQLDSCNPSLSIVVEAEMECATPQRATRRQHKPKLELETLRISSHAHECTSAEVDLTSNVFRQHLRKVLAPEYVEYAFALPDDCGTIWSLLLSDMESLGSGKEAFTQNEASLLTFLRQFFSRELMQVVEDNLLALADSHYGLDYTFGRAKVFIGKSIVDGIREEAAEDNTPLAVFLGQVSKLGTDEEQEDGDHWQIVSRRRAKRNGRVVPSQGFQNGGSSGGGGATGGGGGSTGDGENAGQGASNSGTGGSGDDGHDGGHFFFIEENTIEVHLPAFVTPPRGDPDRKLKVRDRSLLFKEKVHGCCGRLYDAHSEQGPGFVSIFHGTRTSSLESFQFVGISPRAEGSEFCQMPAFYTSNSVLHAFERPLHHKLGRCIRHFISVLEFRVDVAVLHGERPPPGDSRPFDIRWFPRPSEDWKCFCIGNMAVNPRLRALAPLHGHDIVIGPVCKPLDGGTDMGVVTDRLGRGNVYVCQIAFCSPRAWSWLEGCFKRVFHERRDADAA